MARTVDQANAVARRTAILKAAMRCFSEKGLHQTSLADIGRASGMRPGHIHYYFPSKLSIIQAVNVASTGQIADRIEGLFEKSDDPTSAVLALHEDVEDLRREWEISPLLRIELTAESLRDPALRESTLECSARIERSLLEAARRAIATGQLGPDVEPEAFARMAVLIWNAMGVVRVRDDLDLAAFERTAVALIGNWKANPT